MSAILALWLPILLSSVALFFLGFLFWMVLPVHQADWRKLPDERAFSEAIRGMKIPTGNYMIPYGKDMAEMKSEGFLNRQKDGPNGILQVWPNCGADGGMGKALAMQVLFLLGTMFCIAYLATQAHDPGAEFRDVFQFVGAATMIVLTAGHLPGRIWYKRRVLGHLIDGVVQGVAAGLIFAALWPAA